MKKLSFLLVIFLSLISINSFATATRHDAHSKPAHEIAAHDIVTLHFFWSKDCPHCVAAHPFIDKLKAEYPWLKVKAYEVSGNPHNGRLFEKMAKEHGKETSFVPTFFVCDKMIVGYTSAQSTGSEIREAVEECHKRTQS